MSSFGVDFILTRGPERVCRRFSAAVPLDGTPVTIGRALHCGAVLDPWLVFASQVQCSIFAVPSAEGDAPPDPQQPPPLPEGEEGAGGDRAAAGGEAPLAQVTPARRPLADVDDDDDDSSSSSAAPVPRLFLTDMCSSNGTFVNGVRVGSADAVPLCDGDACIFGGMRDVAVGAALPADAFAGPELVVWRVHLSAGAKAARAAEYAYTATPTLLPTPEVLLQEGREVLGTALRSLHRPPHGASAAELTPSPAALHGAAGAMTPAAAAAVPQQLFATPGSPPEGAQQQQQQQQLQAEVEGEGEAEADVDGAAEVQEEVEVEVPDNVAEAGDAEEASGGDRDFFLLLSTLQTPSNALGATAPPPPLHFHALRLGSHTYHVPIASLLGSYVAKVEEELEAAPTGSDDDGDGDARSRRRRAAKRGRRGASAEAAARAARLRALPAPVHAIQFSDSHWKWVMDDPNGAAGVEDGGSSSSRGIADAAALPAGLSAAPSVFHAMLPVTSIETTFVCKERLGVAVELREGCGVPRVRPAVVSGAPENRWLVWMLEDTQAAAKDGDAAEEPAAPKRRRTTTGGGRAAAAADAPVPALITAAQTASLHARFDEWVGRLAAFYGPFNVPAPLEVDSETFDNLFAPERVAK